MRMFYRSKKEQSGKWAITMLIFIFFLKVSNAERLRGYTAYNTVGNTDVDSDITLI